MKLLVALLAALIVAVGAGHLVASHPGIVAISFEGKDVRLSLALFCVLTLGGTLLTLFLLRALYRVLTIRSRYRRWRTERARRRAQLALNDGLLALDLSAARIAVLLRDAGGLRAALDPAIGQLERHFDGADPTVRAGLARLREIAGLDIAPALPSLARSADALGLALREEKAL